MKECWRKQGSTISGILYTLYTNEVPLIHKLLHNKWYQLLTNKVARKYKNIEHYTINYIDDSTSIIGFTDHSIIRNYLHDYYTLLHCYYNVNKLKINADKTLFMINCKDNIHNLFKNY